MTNAVQPIAETETVWAVGSPIQHFDGEAWTEAPGVRSEGELFGVAAVNQNDVWAVGSLPLSNTTKSVVLRFDGLRWTAVDGPAVPGSDALTGIDALADGTLLGVGYKDVEAGRRTLAILGSTCEPPS